VLGLEEKAWFFASYERMIALVSGEALEHMFTMN